MVKGYVLAAAAALLFSSKSILIKLAYAAGGNAESLLALRMLMALPVYLSVWIWVRRRSPLARPTSPAVRASAAVGVLGYGLSSYLDMKGLELISAPVERLILFTYPFFVAVLGACFFGLRIQGRAIVGLFISYAGLALVLRDSLHGPLSVAALGVCLVFASAASYALFQLLASRLVRQLGSIEFTCIAMTAAALFSIVAYLLKWPTSAWLCGVDVLVYAALLALLGTVLPSFLLSAALKALSAQANSAIGAVSPVCTIALSMLILGDSMSPTALAGGAVVVAGAVWFTAQEVRTARPLPAEPAPAAPDSASSPSGAR